MKKQSTLPLSPSTESAIGQLREMIQYRYPGADFAITQGDDPEGFYLRVTVDSDDIDEVVSQDLAQVLAVSQTS